MHSCALFDSPISLGLAQDVVSGHVQAAGVWGLPTEALGQARPAGAHGGIPPAATLNEVNKIAGLLTSCSKWIVDNL